MVVHMPAMSFAVVTINARLGPWTRHIGLEILENLTFPGGAERALTVNPRAIEKDGWL